MHRLTDKRNNSFDEDGCLYYTNGKISSGIVYIDDDKNYTNACIDKLGQLEDIEEDLGIDLITIFKALNNGIYIKDLEGNICKKYVKLDLLNGLLLFFAPDEYTGLGRTICSYKKSWALTEEELKFYKKED